MGDLDPATARAETARGKALLEQLTGSPCVGFRAPTYSLEPASAWLPELLTSLGFTYSSSLLGVRNPLHGWPGAPCEPFRWPCGLVELPVPVAGSTLSVPYLGGTYLRLLPARVVAAARTTRRGRTLRAPWLYVHAYDLDTQEAFWWVPDAGRLAPLLWVGRRGLWAKLDRLVAAGTAPPLRERLHEADGGVFVGAAHG